MQSARHGNVSKSAQGQRNEMLSAPAKPQRAQQAQEAPGGRQATLGEPQGRPGGARGPWQALVGSHRAPGQEKPRTPWSSLRRPQDNSKEPTGRVRATESEHGAPSSGSIFVVLLDP